MLSNQPNQIEKNPVTPEKYRASNLGESRHFPRSFDYYNQLMEKRTVVQTEVLNQTVPQQKYIHLANVLMILMEKSPDYTEFLNLVKNDELFSRIKLMQMAENPFKSEETLELAEQYFVDHYNYMKIIEIDIINDGIITLYQWVKNYLVKQDDVMNKPSPIKQREKIDELEKQSLKQDDKSSYYYNHPTISQNSYQKNQGAKIQSPSKLNQFSTLTNKPVSPYKKEDSSVNYQSSYGTTSLNYQDHKLTSPLKKEDLQTRVSDKLFNNIQQQVSPSKIEYKPETTEYISPSESIIVQQKQQQEQHEKQVLNTLNSLKENQEKGTQMKLLVMGIKNKMLDQKQTGNLLGRQLEIIQSDISKAIKLNQDKEQLQQDIYNEMEKLDLFVKDQQFSIVQGADTTLRQLRQSQNLQQESDVQQKKIEQLTKMLVNQQDQIQFLKQSGSPYVSYQNKVGMNSKLENENTQQQFVEPQQSEISGADSKAQEKALIQPQSNYRQPQENLKQDPNKLESAQQNKSEQLIKPTESVFQTSQENLKNEEAKAPEDSQTKQFTEMMAQEVMVELNSQEQSVTIKLPKGRTVSKENTNAQLCKQVCNDAEQLQVKIKFGANEEDTITQDIEWQVNDIFGIDIPDEQTVVIKLAKRVENEQAVAQQLIQSEEQNKAVQEENQTEKNQPEEQKK